MLFRSNQDIFFELLDTSNKMWENSVELAFNKYILILQFNLSELLFWTNKNHLPLPSFILLRLFLHSCSQSPLFHATHCPSPKSHHYVELPYNITSFVSKNILSKHFWKYFLASYSLVFQAFAFHIWLISFSWFTYYFILEF